MKSLSKKSATKWLLSSAIASTLIFTLAGCSNTEEENPKLEKTSDASVTEPTDYVPASADGPAQNVPEPRLPAVATENTEEGAQAALEYFWEAEAFASLTGQTTALISVSDDDCAFCDESIAGWSENYEDGYWSVLHGDIEVDIDRVDISPDTTGEKSSIAHIFFRLTEPATDFYDRDGNHLDASFDVVEAQEWFAVLVFDATAQLWKIEWLGLEDDVIWEDQ